MKRLGKVVAVAAACAAVTCSVAAFTACGSKTDSITITGSSSVTPLMEALAAAYEEDHDIRITISESSSGAGISDTQNGNNDFGMASRDLYDNELATGISGVTLCQDGIALVVGSGCTATNITTEEVKALYSSGTPACDGVITTAVGRDSGSGTRDFFDEHFELTSYDSSVTTQSETGYVVNTLMGTTNAVGYISYGSLAGNDSIKAISLDGVYPTLETMLSGDYSLVRNFVIVLPEGGVESMSQAAQDFYNYIMSDEAQEVISSEGYISIK